MGSQCEGCLVSLFQVEGGRWKAAGRNMDEGTGLTSARREIFKCNFLVVGYTICAFPTHTTYYPRIVTLFGL